MVSSGRKLWDWLSEEKNQKTLRLIGAGLAALTIACWAVFTHFHRAGEIKLTPEQYADYLTYKDKQKYAELEKTKEDDPKRKALEIELAAIQKKLANLETAFKEQEEKLSGASKALEDFKSEFPPDQVKKARQALVKGETGAAEALFQQALAKGTSQAAEAAYQLGRLAESRIDYGQAERYYRQAVQLQPDNPMYLTAAGNLSHTLGHYPESEKLLKRALEMREKSLHPEHPDVALSLNNLAVLYKTQGKYVEAEPLLKRALAIDEMALGPEHPDVAANLNNLAGLYHDQGRYGEAEPLYMRALAIREKTLGPEHPHVAESLNNLASLYIDQGKYGEAEPLSRRALAILEKTSPEHPNVATCLENYASLLKKTGREAEATPLDARAKAIRAKHAEQNPQK